ncbi:tumor necrosis factor receptor superfamily member 5-like, partial [Mercenaria mercenaria]|uniref:tumor necrosis factor receptor superfamily member 5-like n=1 Tax=Mercenaria mercenaria TaxID=6596 RepID=UPI00234E5ABC
ICLLKILKELKEWALLFLTYIICVDYLLGITLPCDEKYQAENGNLCYPCSEGFYKVSDCVVNGEQARCRPCRNGEYQPSCDNSTKCDHCKLFCIDARQVKVKNCTATSDIECLCKAGFYWKPSTWKPDEGYCDSHSKCGAGEGLVEKGTPYKNTKCKPCEEGVTYSSNASFDTCVPCSVCNSTEAFKCITTRDVVCGALPDKPSPTESSSEG